MTPKHGDHRREWHGAHVPWSYSPHAFRWYGEIITGINFIPLATEMHSWLLRRGELSFLSTEEEKKADGYKNPYAFSGAAISLITANIVNSSHAFATQQTDHDNVESEVKRLRLYNETILYVARFCEVAIKQLIYCTQIPESRYSRMALGALLESPCPDCKKANGKPPHNISMIGSLACPFHLCREFDHCAMNHLDIANKLRNSQAAHSSTQTLNIRTTTESKSQCLSEVNEVLMDFVHMLSHLEKIEKAMTTDLLEKAREINKLKHDGLKASDCNFKLTPGEPFTFAKE